MTHSSRRTFLTAVTALAGTAILPKLIEAQSIANGDQNTNPAL